MANGQRELAQMQAELQLANERLRLESERRQQAEAALAEMSEAREREVAEAQRAVEALRRSHRRHETLIRTLGCIVWEADAPAFQFRFVGQQAERLLGYPLSRWTDEPTFWRDHLHPEDRDRVMAVCLQAAAEAQSSEFEFRMVAADGQVIWLRSVVTAVAEERQPARLYGVMMDVTPHKRALEGLRESEARQRAVLDALPDLMFLQDSEGRFLDYYAFDPALLLGAPADFLGKKTAEVLPPEMASRLEAGRKEALRTGEVQIVEYAAPLPAGTRYFEARFSPCGETQTVAMARDVSEGKQAREALEQAHAELKRAADWTSALNAVAGRLEATRDPAVVMEALGRELKALGIACFVALAGQSDPAMTVQFYSPKATRLRAVERLVGQQVLGFQLTREGFPLWDEVVEKKRAVIVADPVQIALALAPTVPRPLLERLLPLIGIPRGASQIVVPLVSQARVIGILGMWGVTLRDNDLPVFSIFASQVAAAVASAQLFDEIQRLAGELERRVAERTRDLAALYDVTAVVAGSLDVREALQQSLGRAALALGGQAGALHLREATGERLHLVVQHGSLSPADQAEMSQRASAVARQGEPVVGAGRPATERAAQPGPHSGRPTYLGVPMRVTGKVVGVMSLLSAPERRFNAEEVALLASIADHLAVALANARLHHEAERAAALAERERVARELHDSVTQTLYSLTLLASAAQEQARNGRLDRLSLHLDELVETARQVLKEMRLMLYELRPTLLKREGLVEALRRRLEVVEGRAGVQTRLAAEALALPAYMEEGLYHIAQEALTNALKHASATSVTVSLRAEGDWVLLEVEDDGSGFDPEAASLGGLGLMGMRERAAKMGGTLAVTSAPGRGTLVRVQARAQAGPDDADADLFWEVQP